MTKSNYYIIKDQTLIKSGVMNGLYYSPPEIVKYGNQLIESIKNNNRQKNLFLDHEDTIDKWIGEVINPRILGDEVKGDLVIVDEEIANQLKYQIEQNNVCWGISPTVLLIVKDGNATDIQPKSFSIVLEPAGGEKLMIKITNKRGEDNEKVIEESKLMAEDYALQDVEIFGSGTWNDDCYNDNDLDEIINNFKILKDESGYLPVVKLGHDPNDFIKNSGLPAGGWITNLKRVGDKLLADFSDVPKKICDLIKRKKYSKRSAEICVNAKHPIDDIRNIGKTLKAVAFLGQDIPAVKNLKDIDFLYSENANEEDLRLYFFREGGKLMEIKDNDIKKHEEDIKEKIKDEPKKDPEKQPTDIVDPDIDELASKKYPKLTSSSKDQSSNNEFYLSKIAELYKRIVELELATKISEVNEFVEKLTQKGSYLPKFNENVIPVLTGLPATEQDLKRYSEMNPEDVTLQREVKYQQHMRQLLEKIPKMVDFSELSASDKSEKIESKDDMIHNKATKIMKDSKVSYREAVGIAINETS